MMFRNWIAYLFILITLLIFVIIREDHMTYTAFYAVLIMPILSFLQGLISINQIGIESDLSSELISKNEVISLKTTFTNKGLLPCYFAKVQFDFESIGLISNSNTINFSLGIKKTYVEEIEITGIYRGVFEINPSKLWTYDFLGLFKYRGKLNDAITITIAPSITEMEEIISEITDDSEEIIKNQLLGHDISGVTDLREYQPTDSYKQIHWKATAKRNMLISKNPQDIETQTGTFIIDNKRIMKTIEKTLETEDKMMEVAISVMKHNFSQGHRIKMLATNYSMPDFTTDFTSLYRHAALLPFGDFESIGLMLKNYLFSNRICEDIYFFTQNLDNDIIDSLEKFTSLGCQVTVFLFANQASGHLKKLKSLKIAYFNIQTDEQVNKDEEA